MGGGASVPEFHDRIQQRLKNLKTEQEKEKKILLLGAGECGKSTILKQVKIIHAQNSEKTFTKEEKLKYTQLVRNNTVTSIQSLLEACMKLGISFSTANFEPICERIMDLDPTDPDPDLSIKDDINMMWQDDGVQEAKRREKEFHLLDSAPYFLNALERTFDRDYNITTQDILRTRITTTGIIETTFQVENSMQFRMYDVGGQRGERKRWIHSFDDVNAIMFIASLSEYDQVLAEDRSVNRLDESLNLFESIANLPWFEKAAIFLFLNKQDLFEIKIKTVPIADYHPDYDNWVYEDENKKPVKILPWEEGKDKQNFTQGLYFFRDYYQDRLEWDDEQRQLYTFPTDATCTDQIQNMWKATRHSILHSRLYDSALQLF